MPKKTFSVDDFSGGANTFESPQNVAPNEVAICNGFHIAPGEVSVIGDMKATYTGDSGGNSVANDGEAAAGNRTIEPGYGLFTFSHDYEIGGTLGETKYMILLNGVKFDIWANAATPAWVTDKFNMGTGASDASFSSVKPCFFIADGAVRISPGNFAKADTGGQTNGEDPLEIVYGGYADIATDVTITDHVESGDTIVVGNQEAIVLYTGEDASSMHVGRNMTGSFPAVIDDDSTIYAILDCRWGGVVHRKNFKDVTSRGTFSDWYYTYTSPRPPVLYNDTIDHDNVTINTLFPFLISWYNEAATAVNDGNRAGNVSIGYFEDTDNADSTWSANAKVNLYITALHDGSKQESQPHKYSSQLTIPSGKELAIWVGVEYVENSGTTYSLNKRATGARLYYEDVDNDPGILFQLLEIDFEKGCKKVTEEEHSPWLESVANISASCPADAGKAHGSRTGSNAFIFADPPKFVTYEINTGYPASTTIHARYKTATVLNRRLFVGNVYQDGIINGDRMIGSPVNQFDILPSSNTIDVTVGDGDQIVKLEGFADRILQFKKRSLYIINVGAGQGGEYLESQHKNMGVENPSQTCLTEYGVAWVNSKGVFLYDGKEISDLTRNKLKLSDSTLGKGLNITESDIPLIGFHPTNKWLIVHKQSNVAGNNEDNAWILDFKSGAWVFANNFTHDGRYKTNMAWASDNELIFASGTNSSYTPEIAKYQSSTTCTDANFGVIDTLQFLTKEFDLELPGVKKTLKSVHVSYAASAHSYLEADIIYKDSSGEFTVALEEEKSGETYYTEALGFKSTSGAVRTVRLTPVSSVKKAYTFQFKLHNDDAAYPEGADFKLYSISFTYRLLGAK